jgi:hypothetical protein
MRGRFTLTADLKTIAGASASSPLLRTPILRHPPHRAAGRSRIPNEIAINRNKKIKKNKKTKMIKTTANVDANDGFVV